MKPFYEHGGITIYHGDCADVLPSLSGVSVVLTSPPYNLGGFHQMHGGNSAKWEYAGFSDKMPEAAYQNWQIRICDLAFDTGAKYLFYSHRNRIVDGEMISPLYWLSKTKWVVHQQVVVNKGSGANVDKRRFFPVHEHIYVCFDDPSRKLDNKGSFTDVWFVGDQQTNRKDLGHPASMPKSCATKCLASAERGLVVDPFMGSGTTLVAAKSEGLRAIGIEIEERYCEIAAQRLSQEVLDLGGVA